MFASHCPLVFDTLITLFVFFTAAGLGSTLLRRLRIPTCEPLEYGLFALSLGLGLLSYVPFALFAAHVGSPRFVVGGLVLACAVGFPDSMVLLTGFLRRAGAVARGARRWPGWFWPIVVASVLMLVPVYLRALCPPGDPDALTYHVTGPLRYLDAGRFMATPTSIHLSWPLGVEMLFALGMAVTRYYAAGMIQFGMGLTAIGLIYCLGRRAHSTQVGVVAAGLAFTFLRWEMGAAYIEIGLALYATAALCALWMGWQASRGVDLGLPAPDADSARRWWLLAALLAGFAAAAKLSGVLFVLALAVALGLILLRSTPGGAAQALRGAALCLLAGLLVALPWYIRSWVQTGDPVYPYLYKLFGGTNWDAAAQARLTTYFQVLNSFHASRLSARETLMARGIITAAFALIGTVIVMLPASRHVRPIVVYAFASVTLIVLVTGVYIRFLIPATPPFCLLAAWALRRPLDNSRPMQWLVGIAIAAILIGPGGIPLITYATMSNAPVIMSEYRTARQSLPVIIGRESRGSYLSKRFPFYAVGLYIDEGTEPNDVVVVGTWEQWTSWVERPTLTTNVWLQNALRYRDDLLPGDLRRLHAKYLVLSPGICQAPIPVAGLNREDRLRAEVELPKLVDIAKRFGEPLQEVNGYDIFRLHL
jgi:hypothetical protein